MQYVGASILDLMCRYENSRRMLHTEREFFEVIVGCRLVNTLSWSGVTRKSSNGCDLLVMINKKDGIRDTTKKVDSCCCIVMTTWKK